MSYCDCYDVSDVWSETIHTSRKDRWCANCSGPISAGDRYQRVASLFEGHWTTYSECMPCVEGPVAYVEKHCGCRSIAGFWLYEHLREVFYEHDFDTLSARMRVGRMLVGMRRRSAAARLLAHATETRS